MWRSKLIIRFSRRTISSSIQNQAETELPHLIRSQSPHFSVFLSQNLRLFSNNSSPNSQKSKFDSVPSFTSQESETPLKYFSENTSDSNLSSQKSNFDDTPSFISPESETPLSDFDKSSNFNSEEGDNAENPSSLSQEKADVEEKVGSVVAEETLKTPEIDVEQVESVLSLLQSSVDGSLESSLDNMGLDLNEEFVVRVIETPLVPGDSLIRFYKWASKKSEYLITARSLVSLVQAVGAGLRKKEAYAVWDFVKEIGEEGELLLNTEVLNELISLFWKLGKGKAGLEVFNKFEEFGCEPNADSYYLTIEALCSRSIYDWAWPVCEKMLNSRNLPDGKKIGRIICCFCKGNKAKDAHLVYLMAKEKNIASPKTVLKYLIISLCDGDETVKLALDLLNDFSGDTRKYAIKPFACVVRSLCRINDIEEAQKLLVKMIENGPPPGNAVFNFVINKLSKAGHMDEGLRLVKLMESRGLRPDVYTYSVIISGYVKEGKMDEAHNVLSDAKKKHTKLCPVTFHTLIRGYIKLEEFDKAVELLSEMKESGVKPNTDEYNKMIQSLCLKALDWQTAEKLLEEMKENGLHPNGNIKALIRSVKELEEEVQEQESDDEVVSLQA